MADTFDIYGDSLTTDSTDPAVVDEFSLYDLAVQDDSRKKEDLGKRRADNRQVFDDRKLARYQCSILLGNLAWWTTDQEIEDLFTIYGKIRQIRFFEDPVNGKGKGYVLLEYYDKDIAKKVYTELKANKITLHKKDMAVELVSESEYRDYMRPRCGREGEGNRKPEKGEGQSEGQREGQGEREG
ncbi:RNA recognition motif-containing protein [Planoprotostelium fungivorum]|uniref:RNA recognition motif-containing protein n=1 Tax=Planoprotostelium fungivorum TaxID=1890364 RepID=A0A2P6N470_9EUKA|nr:RNA recognition motif-containing protein [Planoprotostelium fungivorum]